MFKFFKKKDNISFNSQKELIFKIFSLLPEEFVNIKKQLNEGLLTGFKKEKPYYIKFYLQTEILNKYEDKNANCYEIKGIKIFDKNLQDYTAINLDIAYGIFLGYSTPDVKELYPDINKIDIGNYWVKSFENNEFERIKSLLDKDELKLINPNDVYELKLEGHIYYHLKDIEDGDFIGIDEMKKLYKITHDPYKITEINKKLSDII
jgi:hypothetical protein